MGISSHRVLEVVHKSNSHFLLPFMTFMFQHKSVTCLLLSTLSLCTQHLFPARLALLDAGKQPWPSG